MRVGLAWSSRGRSVLLAATVAGLIAIAGCAATPSQAELSTPGSAAAADSPDAPTSALAGPLRVFAAASLKTTFDDLRTTFMAQHPGLDFPQITYDGSSTLAAQIQEGAPADVFASADEKTMDTVGSLLTDRVDFASNTLRIAVAPGNPKHITSLADLAKSGVLTVICAPQVPCGSASHTALDEAGVSLKPASEEQSVTAVLTKVATGEADAGLVYATEIRSSDGAVDGVDFAQAAHAVNIYPVAAISGSPHLAAARAFIELVTGPTGRSILAAAGFGGP